MITLFRNKYTKGWPRHAQSVCERGYAIELGPALERSYSSDAHFAPYASPNRLRLTSEALDGSRAVVMNAIVFDLDCPATHGTSEPAPDDWRVENRLRVLAAAEQHPGVYGYDTRGGLRFLWLLPEPVELRTTTDADRWRQDYAVCCAYFERRWAIAADPSCGDWQRLYRLPRVTRDRKKGRENRPVWGDPNNIGTLRIDATPSDMRRARELTKAFDDRRQIGALQPSTTNGMGLLFELLRARGDVGRQRSDGSFVIRCPNEREHTTGRTGDGSTLLYLPAPSEHVGAIHCLHGHCSGLRARDWLQLFTSDEVEHASVAIGRPARGRCAA